MNVFMLVSVFKSVEEEFFLSFLWSCGFCNPLSQGSLRYNFFYTTDTPCYFKLWWSSNSLGGLLFLSGQLVCLVLHLFHLSHFLHYSIFGSTPSLLLQPVIKNMSWSNNQEWSVIYSLLLSSQIALEEMIFYFLIFGNVHPPPFK